VFGPEWIIELFLKRMRMEGEWRSWKRAAHGSFRREKRIELVYRNRIIY
jgi:hypothetical protein